ncbi:MAG: ROK family protein [Pseudomonadota bacterium]
MKTKVDTAVGLDVGGTNIRAARISAGGRVLGRVIERVVSDRTGFASQALRLIAAVRDDTTCAVGIGIPGRVDGNTGAILSAGNLDIAGLDLSALVRTEAKLPCRIENDAAMALIAEGQGTVDLIAMVTVGTGVGGALLRGGQPFYGGSFAGQFGHIVVASDGPLCNCGRTGCVETFSAGPALALLIAKEGLPATTDAANLLSAADEGDTRAETILTLWADPMKRALHTLMAIVDPTKVIIGGGLGVYMARAVNRNSPQNAWFNRPVVAARLGDNAGVIGAGLAGLLVTSS